MEKKQILIIIGSMRKLSFNRQLAEIAAELMEADANVRILDYADIPYMNQDLEFPPQESILRVRKEVKEADGLWIFSPEYNHAIPGGLKNLLDWLSRPEAAGSGSVLAGKAVTFCGAAGASGSVCVQDDLLFLLNFIGMNVMPGPRVAISLTSEEFQTNRLNLSERNQKYLQQQSQKFLGFLNKN